MIKNIFMCIAFITLLSPMHAGKNERALAHQSSNSWGRKALAVGLGALHILGGGQTAHANPCEERDGISLCYPPDRFLVNPKLPGAKGNEIIKRICAENRSQSNYTLECITCDEIYRTELDLGWRSETLVCTTPETTPVLRYCEGPGFTIKGERLLIKCEKQHILPVPWTTYVWRYNWGIDKFIVFSTYGFMIFSVGLIMKNEAAIGQ